MGCSTSDRGNPFIAAGAPVTTAGGDTLTGRSGPFDPFALSFAAAQPIISHT